VEASERTGVLRLFHVYQSLARRQVWACAVVALLTLALRTALLPWLPIPKPVIHDEFSYLLAGDTYAHGRLANPPHPFRQHFETFQELQQPTYASKYQPLQGLALAFGEKFFDQPWIGVLLTTALMCAAVCWMLQGWIAAEWALAGALLFALRVGVLSYWMNSYEGGSIPAIGGALALGAMARIWRSREFYHAVTWAIGISMLMLSRPYDAAVLAISSAAMLAWLLCKSSGTTESVTAEPSHVSDRNEGRSGSARPLFRAAVPAILVLALSFAAVAYNDYRVTGDALSLPYQVHDRQYAMASMFLLFPLRREPVYRHAVMRDFWARWNVDQWKESRTAPVAQFLGKVYILSDFFFGFWPIAIPLLLSPFALKTTEERLCAGFLAICMVSLAPLIGVLPHYAAAFSGVFYLRFLQSLQRLSAWRKPAGPLLAASISVLFVVAFLNSAVGLTRGGNDPVPFAFGRDSLSTALALRGARFGAARDAMDRDLANLPGGQLVLVRYQPGHDPQEEWVFNHADIDRSRVVWAREMGPAEDAPFLDYFKDRHVWLAEPDATPLRLTPYLAPRKTGTRWPVAAAETASPLFALKAAPR
jgi:hypothetical protein